MTGGGRTHSKERGHKHVLVFKGGEQSTSGKTRAVHGEPIQANEFIIGIPPGGKRNKGGKVGGEKGRRESASPQWGCLRR